MKRRILALGVVSHKGRYLIAQRKDSSAWEFISASANVAEIAEETLLRAMMQEFAIFGVIRSRGQPYTMLQDKMQWTIISYLIESATENFTIYSKEHKDLKWVTKEELQQYRDCFSVRVPMG